VAGAWLVAGAAGVHLPGMTVSMRVMSAGDGYEYLLRTVAAGDGDRSLSTPLTRYYAEEGTPPGFWLGAGLSRLGHGELESGGRVSEAQLQLLIGMGHDPITGQAWARRTGSTRACRSASTGVSMRSMMVLARRAVPSESR
jgi:hypothetical protein